MIQVISLPCHTEALYLARRTLQQQSAPSIAILSAVEILETSRDWEDLGLVQRTRKMVLASERTLAAETVRSAGESSEPHHFPYISSPHARTTAMRTVHIAGFAAIITLAAAMLWTAAATSSANAQQQAAIWRSQH